MHTAGETEVKCVLYIVRCTLEDRCLQERIVVVFAYSFILGYPLHFIMCLIYRHHYGRSCLGSEVGIIIAQRRIAFIFH